MEAKQTNKHLDMNNKIAISSNSPGARLFILGNEAIARGAIEAGARVVAAYPGTPSTEIVETLIDHHKDLEMYVEWSVNEKVAFGLAFGASLCGARGMAVMKHVGVNVALDSIMTAAYIGASGGLVLVEAEDPGQWSSQNEQDNRFIAEQAYLPVLEPSSAQEAKDMTVDAFRLSEEFGQPFVLRSVTRIGHSRSDITLGEISLIRKEVNLERDSDKLVMLPAVARKHRRLMVARLAKIKEAVNSWPYNNLKIRPKARLGIITAGISYSYALETLSWLKMREEISLLKIGTPYPLPEKLIVQFLRSVPEILVVEELEPYIENHVKVIAQENRLDVTIHGKDVLPLIGELSVRKVTEAVCKLSEIQPLVDFALIDQTLKETEALLPLRPPTLCAGCPHRASHFVIKTVCDRITKETGIDPIRPGDIGCNCLGVHPPLNAIDISTCMGGGFDLSNGIARVTDVPIIAHLGDSTFFHSGMAPMVNAVYNQAKITMIVLDNLTTAMTGSQPSPSSGCSSSGEPIVPVLPEEIARASGIKFVEVIDPQDLEKATETLERAIKFNGPSFLVFRRPCAIMDQRERRVRGEKIVPCEVKAEKCIVNASPFCTAACPLHIDARGYIKLTGDGQYNAALKLIKEKTPFPGILGRICTRPCEAKCKRGEVDESLAIAALKRTAVDFGKMEDEDLVVSQERQEKVAIVGGGPAGLMSAYDLRKMGYQVTLFEALSTLGGMLSVGIPAYRLPKEITQNEIKRILKLGMEVRLNTRVGTDIQLAEMQQNYQAVFIAAGAHQGRRLNLENEGLPGMINGIEFLRDVNMGKKVQVRDRAVIVGGGNVAVDCARTCLRSGFKEVTIVYRRERKQMPAIAEEVNEAEKEGVKIVFLSSPSRILAEAGRVTGIECVRMRLGQLDSSGRERPEPVPDSSFEIKADLIIKAVGEQPDLSFAGDTPLSIQNGLIAADRITLATSIPGIFAGGDVITGPASVIEALAAGRKAAISIDRYIRGESLFTNREGEGMQLSPLVVDASGVTREERHPVPKLSIAARQSGMKEVELGYTLEEAHREALRCLSCGCERCIQLLGCPAISKIQDEILIDGSQCPGCGLCAQICPVQAIEAPRS